MQRISRFKNIENSWNYIIQTSRNVVRQNISRRLYIMILFLKIGPQMKSKTWLRGRINKRKKHKLNEKTNEKTKLIKNAKISKYNIKKVSCLLFLLSKKPCWDTLSNLRILFSINRSFDVANSLWNKIKDAFCWISTRFAKALLNVFQLKEQAAYTVDELCRQTENSIETKEMQQELF